MRDALYRTDAYVDLLEVAGGRRFHACHCMPYAHYRIPIYSPPEVLSITNP